MTSAIIIMFFIIALLLVAIVKLCLDMETLQEGYARQLQAMVEQNEEIIEQMKKRMKIINEILKDVDKLTRKK